VKNFICTLTHLGIIEVSGTDATSFLQAQLTSDLSLLSTEQIQSSAWCNPQGRVIANFLIIRHGGRYLLLLSVDLVNKICQRLRMFILRSNVSVTDRTGELSCIGIYGDESIQRLQQQTGSGIPATTVISRTADRVFLLDATRITDLLSKALSDSGCMTGKIECWRVLDIETGLPWILNVTSEQVLPQELNLDQMSGLSYNKGCYPGQEIVARLHFRGQQKRRLYAGNIESTGPAPDPGTRLSTGPDTGSSGIIINSVRETPEVVRILAVVNIDDAETKTVLTDNGEPIKLQLLHYTNPAER